MKEGNGTFGGPVGGRSTAQNSRSTDANDTRLIFVERDGNKADFIDNVAPYEI